MIILGSTGSIGQNTLDVARRFSLNVKGLCAFSNTDLLNEQIKEFKPKFVAIGDKSKAKYINHKQIFVGSDGILEMIESGYEQGAVLINALVGFAGLAPTLKASTLGYKIALANKESLVVAGKFLNTQNIIPVDSEHFALWYLMNGRRPKRLIVTASGGAFRDTPLEQLKFASLREALKHPNWKMGKKITIDSATMVNKLFELLEARWLFDCEEIDAIVETKSIIHALVDFFDGSTTAHIANADMRLPISFALLGETEENILQNVDLLKVRNIEFKEIDVLRYPVWQIREQILKKPSLGVVLNAANEVAVGLFLESKIGFTQISECVLGAIEKFEDTDAKNLEEVFEIDAKTRVFCAEIFHKKRRMV